MKNVNTVLTYIALVAIVVLFILQFTKTSAVVEGVAAKPAVMTKDFGDRLPLAYVNTDSLLLNYEMAKDLNEVLVKQQEDARTNIGEEARVLDAEVREHQRKIQNNGYLSYERAQNEEAKLQQKNQKLTELSNKLGNEISEKQMKVSEQLRDSIVNYLEEYNKIANFELIYSNTLGGNVLYAKKVYNITEEVLGALNRRYIGSKE